MKVLLFLFIKIIWCKIITEITIVDETVYVAGIFATSISSFSSATLPSSTSTITSDTATISTSSTPIIATSSTSTTYNDIYSDIYNYNGQYNLNQTFALQILKETNTKRSLHNATTLSWNATVFDYAANYALGYNCSGILQHSGGSYGENLAIGYTTIGAVDAWYNEGYGYAYGSEDVYNHFTALIWNSSTGVGCQFKYCGDVWGDYVVCSYYTAGNVIGYSSLNVFPLIS